MASVSLEGVVKRYGAVEAVRGIDLDIHDTQFVALVGPSGCGKTTTLRMIAGLEEISGGTVAVDGRVVNDVAPKDRDMAMVFQSYALYPHRTVFENMAFGLRLRGVSKPDIKRRVNDAARILELGPLLDRRPKALSGGQRQRVAMGRAIVRDPAVFLFDEPLSNLDAKLRVQMRAEIRKLHATLGTTMIYVTHDQVEAVTLADVVAVMNAGRIEQAGPPSTLYNAPRTRFVAGFLGSPPMNLLPCRVSGSLDGLMLHLNAGAALPIPADRTARYAPYIGREMVFGIRPEHLVADAANASLCFAAEITVVEPLGAETVVLARAAGTDLAARLPGDAAVRAGDVLGLRPDLSRMHLLDPTTDLVVQ